MVGFASLSPYRPRPGYATAVEDSIYVAADRRGKGVGRAAAQRGRRAWPAPTASTRSSPASSATQPASVALHKACGFDFVGVEREIGRKFGRWIDVAILQLLL